MIITEEQGRKCGILSSVDFVTESGELLNIAVEEPTTYLEGKNLKTDEKGRILIPFGAVKSVGDYVIVSESELS